MAETLDSEVLVISNTKQFQIQLKLLLEQSPYLEGICYPPISKIYFQQFNDEVIKKVIQFCKYGKILSESSSDDDKEELMKFAEQTKMDKLKEYLNRTSAIEDKYPHLEAQGACFEIPSPPQTVVPEITDEEEENVETPQVCYINTVMIKPTAEEASEDRVRAQSYIPQDPLHANSPPTTIPVKPPQIIPSTSAHRTISRAPSTADEAEEGILGAKTYESVSYVPAGTLTLQPIPAPAASASEKANRTIFQRISAFFS